LHEALSRNKTPIHSFSVSDLSMLGMIHEGHQVPDQDGGRKLGQGNKGATYSIGKEEGHNDEEEYFAKLLREILRNGGNHQRTRVTLHCEMKNRSSKSLVVLRTAEEIDSLLSFLRDFAASRSRGKSMIAKRMMLPTGPERREEFMHEVSAITRISAALGAKRLTEYTTLNAPELTVWDAQRKRKRKLRVFGLAVQPAQEYFILSERCGPSLDQMPFNDKTVVAFIKDILHGFEIIHQAGLVHGDVKLANMIYCQASARFKLIDWGLAERVTQLKSRYLSRSKPKNYGSPLSWYAWGLWRRVSWATYIGYYLLKAFKVTCCRPPFTQFVLSAGRSFNEFLQTKGSSMSRSQLLQQYAVTFDLFNFGIILAMLATAPRSKPGNKNTSPATTTVNLSVGMRQRLLAFATRLTHYNDPGFFATAKQAQQALFRS
jgi:serine/threonine protein kinase